jgi:hypothetical protein
MLNNGRIAGKGETGLSSERGFPGLSAAGLLFRGYWLL